MYGYTIRGAFNTATWNPYGAPQSVDPAFGRTGHPIYPKVDDIRGNLMPEVPAERVRPAMRPRQVVVAKEKNRANQTTGAGRNHSFTNIGGYEGDCCSVP